MHHGLSGDPATYRQKAIDFARRALEVAGDDPGILVNAALPLAYFGEDIGAMIALVDRALVLNPSFARGWFSKGVLHLWAGHPDAAIEQTEVSLRLSPRANIGAGLCVIGGAHFFARRFRSGRADVAPGDPGRCKLRSAIPLSRCLLRAHGPPG